MRADSVRRFIGITLSGYQPWRALGGEFGNLDGAGSVSILGAVTVGWREAGGRETGPQGARSACRGCRDGGWCQLKKSGWRIVATTSAAGREHR